MKKYLFILLSIICLFYSCDKTKNAKPKTEVVDDTLNLVRYAENFKIYPYMNGYKLIINDLKPSIKNTFYVFNKGTEIPEGINQEQIIRVPIESAIAFSSTQWSVFQRLGEFDKVKGVLESNYSRNEELLRLVSEGKIKDVGTSMSVNTEKVIHLQSDLILYTPYPTVDYSHLKELCSSTMVPFPDYLESHPLGRAEWMKVVGLLCGKEKETTEWFNNVVERYNKLSALCSETNDKPTIFSDLPFENQWYVPGGDSYIAKIFSDAGGDYIWKDNKSTGSLHIDAESVILKAQNADYWRVINSYDTPFTYEALAKENDLYPLFKAFQERQLLVCNVRETGYFEQSQYEPDILLADFIYHFHPDLLKNEWENYTPKYFKLLE
ncbi:MAG: ABC transporter substrate-binding protein [Bacteroidales bacterium]|nr:ABC transporter substrate-binding protein [Bacteroidales bacterium]